MRCTSRLLATAKAARFLEPNTPTGLTGLYTHASPRSTLIYLYSGALEKLKEFPESSVYRQSTENLTNHRLKIVTAVEPAGLKEWQEKFRAVLEKNPEVFTTPDHGVSHDSNRHVKQVVNGKTFIHTKIDEDYDDTRVEWDGEEDTGPVLEGTRSAAERADQVELGKERPGSDKTRYVWSGSEPPLNADQIADIENQIGAGLIEEVIQVAEGELKLIDVLKQIRVWEDLEEKPVEGQWTYFDRVAAAPATQPPPQK